MIRFYETFIDIVRRRELWFGWHSLIIWVIALSPVRSWEDWWRPLFAIAFFVFIAFFATIQSCITQRRLEKFSREDPPVPFMTELPHTETKRE